MAFGAPPEVIDKYLEEHETTSEFELFVEHQAAFEWFIEVQELFNFVNGVCLGLNPIAVESDARMTRRKVKSKDYKKLKIIGQEIAQLINDKNASN